MVGYLLGLSGRVGSGFYPINLPGSAVTHVNSTRLKTGKGSLYTLISFQSLYRRSAVQESK